MIATDVPTYSAMTSKLIPSVSAHEMNVCLAA